ncbi:putative flavin-containing monooxygenase [Myriangium duriaei CBS 260.36]|uniref:Flavin-containing monooxygenase n=1 Tax=Myriangium duriaei CBS 260.36 TaxID=1168546 RepID=A0A9P4JER2_9PEZI|nr:putative flavin-containing monooxygenase [Myriangium duriaei CBS 260.36]
MSLPHRSDLPKAMSKDITLSSGALWRDFLSFTNHLRTFHSSTTISRTFASLAKTKKPFDFQHAPSFSDVTELGDGIAWVNVGFTFTTNDEVKANNTGIVSLVWILRTWLENYDGHGNPDRLEPHSAESATRTDSHDSTPIYDAIIIGAGQAGLGCAGRLKALGCTYLLIEKTGEVGENWTSRYSSLRWHTSKEYGNLPFDKTFLPEDDYMLTTKMIGSGFKRWVDRFNINIMTATTVQNAVWDNSSGLWTITASAAAQDRTFKAKNLILACGSYASMPASPTWPGRERYKGTALHGSEYTSSTPWRGKRGIVVGTANTGHDVAEDMVQAGFSSVTMVQRGKTFVYPAEWLHAAQDLHYNDKTLPDRGDRLAITYPNKITREIVNYFVHKGIASSPERFDALERAGFKLDRYGDIYDNLYNRFGGHYVDIGTSARIARGEIKMKPEAVKGWTEKGLQFEDGSEVEAELIVLCTGFEHDFRKVARKIIGDAADQMDDYFRLDKEGEIRGAFKFAGHPGLYYTGGDIRQCRWYSRFIALQVQADVLGIDRKRLMADFDP